MKEESTNIDRAIPIRPRIVWGLAVSPKFDREDELPAELTEEIPHAYCYQCHKLWLIWIVWVIRIFRL